VTPARGWIARLRGSTPPPAVPASAALTTPKERALEAWRALCDQCLATDRRGTLHVLDGPRSGGAAVWPVSQVLGAALAVDRLEPGTGRLDGLFETLERYRVGDAYAPYPGDRDLYYDDNAWIGLDLAQWHLQGGAPASLPSARRVLGVLAEGEAPGGGVRWKRGPGSSLNTCSTGPAVELALRVHLLTGDVDALEFARRNDAFLHSVLRRDDGLFADHVERDGRVDATVWTYNQGTPVGADVLWWRATEERSYLDRARATAIAALDAFSADGLWGQPAAFNGVFGRNVLALGAVEPMPGLLDVLDGYLDRAWTEARDERTGLLLGGGIGLYDGGGTIDHAALVQLYALRAWEPAWLADAC